MAWIVALGLLGGCGGGPAPDMCVDDSAQCIAKRKARFGEMTSDSSHDWTAKPPSVKEYASGVRLFAYRHEQQRMSCESLRRGIAETSSARIVLTPETTVGISADRVAQIIALSEDVNRELTRTHTDKCR